MTASNSFDAQSASVGLVPAGRRLTASIPAREIRWLFFSAARKIISRKVEIKPSSISTGHYSQACIYDLIIGKSPYYSLIGERIVIEMGLDVLITRIFFRCANVFHRVIALKCFGLFFLYVLLEPSLYRPDYYFGRHNRFRGYEKMTY